MSTSKHSSRGGRVPFRPPYNSKRQNFSRPPQPNSWQASVLVSNKHQRVQCQLCFKFGHTALTCWTRSDSIIPSPIYANISSFQPVLHDPEPSILGTPSTVSDPLWYPNTRATHHITHDSTIFNKKQNYTGPDTVQLGNGSDMPIYNVGSTSLYNASSNHLFTLNNLLHVPFVNKNLLSVSQLLVTMVSFLSSFLIIVMSNIRLQSRLFFKEGFVIVFMFFHLYNALYVLLLMLLPIIPL